MNSSYAKHKTVHQNTLRPRVLIVDDDQFSQVEIVRQLHGVYKVGIIAVFTPEEAIEILKGVHIDYALVDNRFPSHPTDGVDVVRAISAMSHKPKTYVCSVVESSHLDRQYEGLHVDGILCKTKLNHDFKKVFGEYKI